VVGGILILGGIAATWAPGPRDKDPPVTDTPVRHQPRPIAPPDRPADRPARSPRRLPRPITPPDS
jgi:hypothetical protein